MRILLDTHIFLWYISADVKLPPVVRDAIADANNEIFLSAASVWEAVIKHSLGKLPLPESPAIYLPRQRDAHQVSPLAIVEEEMNELASLPPLHRDPFDRLLVAQALYHGMTLASTDAAIRSYSVTLLPAV